jgi:hypothetical protein
MIFEKITIIIVSVIGGLIVIVAAVLTGLLMAPVMLPIYLFGICLKPKPDFTEFSSPPDYSLN